MRVTKHAQERWDERFGNLAMDFEFNRAKKPKKADMVNIQKQCPSHVSIMKRKDLYGLVYKVSPGGVVFVCNSEDLIITVFPYTMATRSIPSDTKNVYRKGKRTRLINFKHKW